MIFVTVGSQKFQFNRLLKKIDNLIEGNLINENVCAQTGYSDYIPKHYDYHKFLDHDEFNRKIEESDIIITHAGTGVIINAIKLSKKVIAVPRLVKYGEHVDDHQIQIVNQFKELNLIEVCYSVDSLYDSYKKVKKESFSKYISNNYNFVNDVEKEITKLLEVNVNNE